MYLLRPLPEVHGNAVEILGHDAKWPVANIETQHEPRTNSGEDKNQLNLF
jgi:hypothetical protein